MFKNPAYLISAAFAAVAGLALAFQDTGRMAKSTMQPLAIVAIVLSVYWNQREIYAAEKKADPAKKLVEMLPKLHYGIWFSSLAMIGVYAVARNAGR